MRAPRLHAAVLGDALVACALAIGVCVRQLHAMTWHDFVNEAAPSVARLLAGDVHGFLASVPSYGGSLVLRAPLLALGGTLGGLDGAYRAGAIACVALLALLGLALAARLRATRRPVLVRWLVLGVVIANPAALWALRQGHPEDLIASVLCVAAILSAARGRVAVAGLAVGVAIACKPWALIAFPLVVAVAAGRPGARAWRSLAWVSLACAAGCLVLLAPLAIASSANLVAAGHTITTATVGFAPEQLWRALGGYHMHLLANNPPLLAAEPTAFVARVSHPLIVALALPAAAAWWLRRRRVAPVDALLLLAALGLARCVLDPWNDIYYSLPFLLALASWEALTRRSVPVLALGASALVWLSFEEVGVVRSATVACAFYLAWTLPAIALMVARSLALAPPLPARAVAQPTVTSSLVKPL